jgi:hypothetical protein
MDFYTEALQINQIALCTSFNENNNNTPQYLGESPTRTKNCKHQQFV